MQNIGNIAEVCARAAHETNNIYNRAIGDTPSPEWDALTDAQRASVVAGAKHALDGGTAADSHALWIKTRVDEGWTYGTVKDFAAKTSPCMVPYDELPDAQRRKDALLQAVVRAMAEALA